MASPVRTNISTQNKESMLRTKATMDAHKSCSGGKVSCNRPASIFKESLVDTPILCEEDVLLMKKRPPVELYEEGSENVEIDSEGNDDTDEEDEDFVANSDENEDQSVMEDSDYDENWDWISVLPSEVISEVRGAISTKILKPTSVNDFEDDGYESDELHTPPNSEDDADPTPRFPLFKVPEGHDPIRFELGLRFNNKAHVMDAVKQYAMENKKNLFFKKNDKMRIVVNCVKDCPFNLRVSKRCGSEYWQIVSFDDDHTCHRIAKNRQAKTEWLAKKFIHTLRYTPEMKAKGLIAEAIDRWGVKLSHHQAYRAKRRAIEMIQGAGLDQYLHLRDYAEELRRSNPNSTVIIKCEPGPKGPIFERMYVCFEACKSAFVHTCRPLIGLDACFLKGEHGGQLMAAVGKDGNNMMIPIAFAVVEAETRDSWQWFLDLLLRDLSEIQQKDWGFISDQQKGLVQAIADIGPNVEHRLCMQHLYGNWRKKYPGVEMKEILWMAARASSVPYWQRTMQKMKDMNEAAWEDMMKVPPKMWTKSHYSVHTQCDLQVNNMCEAFNKAILEHRDKPIITLLEGLKLYITTRITEQKDLMMRYRGNICPKIQKILETNKKAADHWQPYWHNDDDFALFEVANDTSKYVVNLKQKTCACRRWDLSGIPCCHAIACLWHNKVVPEEYVSTYYRKSTFLSTYSHIIMPSNGPKMWPMSINSEPINPPAMRRAPGRPKKQRNKTNDFPKNSRQLPREHKSVRCKKCGQSGHNSRTCKGKTAADRQIPKGGNKRQRVVQRSAKASCSGTAQGSQASQQPFVLTQGSQAPQSQE